MAENKTGWCVSHLMVSFPSGEERVDVANELARIIEKNRSENVQILVGSSFGHESDAILMILAPASEEVLGIEQAIKSSGIYVVDSFFSLTETSEYTTTEPEEQVRVDGLDETDEKKTEMMNAWRERMEIYENHKLYPQMPSKKYMCFYPMSKKRDGETNWYTLDFEKRAEYMRAHGTVGRKYSGRITQLITGATGLTDYEWGVTLLSDSLSDIKDIVYEMRFDEASALYGEFGHFTIAQMCEPDQL